MYIRPYTTVKEVESEIAKLEERLNVRNLFSDEQSAIEQELDYLYSFLPKEV